MTDLLDIRRKVRVESEERRVSRRPDGTDRKVQSTVSSGETRNDRSRRLIPTVVVECHNTTPTSFFLCLTDPSTKTVVAVLLRDSNTGSD